MDPYYLKMASVTLICIHFMQGGKRDKERVRGGREHKQRRVNGQIGGRIV